ncbi:MAG: lipopolysaccharide export system outer membrane lipoprotein component LptE [Rhodobacteraceae bacterium HLUCCA08]|nr:MAG: lipopolysaccharide export system outer membrane lipoprotein component LptE [Rhodobacteraceae bacterium HLUCCA08]
MWSSDRRTLLAGLAALPLAACGFTPVYAPDGPGTAMRGRVAYRAPDTPEGFRLRAQLENRLGRVEQGDYLLTVRLDITEDALAISSAQDVNRYNVLGRADWTLTRPGGDTPVARGSVDTFTAYSASGTTVATRQAQGAARDRLAIALADLIVTELILAAP